MSDFATREEAATHIREHGGSASYPGGTAIYRMPLRRRSNEEIVNLLVAKVALLETRVAILERESTDA